MDIKGVNIQNPQWWLVELDRYGNCSRMVDGAHSDADGANQAAYLIKSMHLSSENCQFAVAKIELFPCEPNSRGVNHEAVKQINSVRCLKSTATDARKRGGESVNSNA